MCTVAFSCQLLRPRFYRGQESRVMLGILSFEPNLMDTSTRYPVLTYDLFARVRPSPLCSSSPPSLSPCPTPLLPTQLMPSRRTAFIGCMFRTTMGCLSAIFSYGTMKNPRAHGSSGVALSLPLHFRLAFTCNSNQFLLSPYGSPLALIPVSSASLG